MLRGAWYVRHLSRTTHHAPTMHPKDLLKYAGINPKKSLGQNFLFDPSILTRIVEAGATSNTDNVVEVGSGLGTLTQALAQQAEHVTAIELDNRILPLLQQQVSAYDNVSVVHGDVLELDPAGFYPNQPYKVIANVPYYITGAILRHFLTSPAKPSLVVLTVQKEVAERVTARPGQLSLLAVSVQYYGSVEIVSDIKAGAFWPRPEIDSAIIRVDLSQPPVPPVNNEKAFFRLVKTGYAQKRKQLQKNLRSLGLPRDTIHTALTQANIAPNRRAQTLSIPEWVALHHAIYQFTN